MPSQRLLKMMDPLGHVTTSNRVLATRAPVGVVWAGSARLAAWISGELAAVGVEPLRATAFRHVDASLRMEAVPRCSLAVIDFSAVSAADIATLTTVRWAGYRGSIIAVAKPEVVSDQTRAVVRIDAIIDPGNALALRDAVSALVDAPSD